MTAWLSLYVGSLQEESLEELHNEVSPPEADDEDEPEELPEGLYLVERLVAKRKKVYCCTRTTVLRVYVKGM